MRQRGVGVTGKSDRVRELAEYARGASVIVSPSPESVTSVFRVRVLVIEEWQFGVKILGIRSKEFVKPLNGAFFNTAAFVGRPMPSDE